MAVTFLLFAFAAVVILVEGRRRTAAIVMSTVTAAFASGFGLILIETLGIRIVVTDRSITSHAPWRLARTIDWSDVVEVRYSTLVDGFLIKRAGGETIRACRFLVGAGELAAAMRSRLDPRLRDEALRKFDQQGSM